MIQKTRFLLAVAVAFVASGCATIFNGTQQSVSFNTEPQGAWCLVSRANEGVIESIYTPERIYVRRDNEPIEIACNRRGYKEGRASVAPTNDNDILGGNILNYTAGIYIDFFTDAFRVLPDEITVPLEKE